jgi:hypothetical protein
MAIRYNWKDISRLVTVDTNNWSGKPSIPSKCRDVFGHLVDDTLVKSNHA